MKFMFTEKKFLAFFYMSRVPLAFRRLSIQFAQTLQRCSWPSNNARFQCLNGIGRTVSQLRILRLRNSICRIFYIVRVALTFCLVFNITFSTIARTFRETTSTFKFEHDLSWIAYDLNCCTKLAFKFEQIRTLSNRCMNVLRRNRINTLLAFYI